MKTQQYLKYLTGLILTAALLAPIATSAQTATPEQTTLSDAEKLWGLSHFWKEVSYNFAFFDQVPELDWDSAYQAFIPRVLETKSTYEYYRELQRFCALLHDGHTDIRMPRWITDSLTYPKLLLAAYGQKPFVRNADTGLVARIPIGSEITAINSEPALEFIKRETLPYECKSTDLTLWDMSIRKALKGWRGSQVTITLVTPSGETRTETLTRNREGTVWARDLAPMSLLEFSWLEKSIAHVKLNSFQQDSIITEFEEILPELYNAKAIVLDLRKNGGGKTTIGSAILGYFTSDSLEGSRWKTPEHLAARKAWGAYAVNNGLTASENKNVKYATGDAWYDGGTWSMPPAEGAKITVPVAVLFGRNTGSAAEDFLIFADKLDKFTYIGEPSNGSTGQPLPINNLPGGGSARICTKRDTYPDGRDFVGYGVEPDIFVEPSVEELISGVDRTRDTALAHLLKLIEG